jgi:hypothetical protein
VLLAKKIKLEVSEQDAKTLEFMQGKCRGLYNWWIGRLRDGERWPVPLAITRLPNKVPNPELIASLLVLGLICTALAYLLFFALVAEVGASRSTIITYLNPAVSVLLGVTFLAEPLNAAITAGFLLIIAESWLSTGGTLPPLGRTLRTHQQRQARSNAEFSKQDTSPQRL